MKIFHQDNVDGRTSASLIHIYALTTYITVRKPEYIAMDNLQTLYEYLPYIDNNVVVYLLGYQLKDVEELKALYDVTNNIILIDNKQEIVETISKYFVLTSKYCANKKKNKEGKYEIRGMVGISKSITEMTWRYLETRRLKNMESSGYIELPYFIKLITDWYTLDLQYGNESRYFNIVMDILSPCPDSIIYKELHNDRFVDKIIYGGKMIDMYRNQFAKRVIDKYGIKINVGYYNGIMINMGYCDITWFDDIKDKDCDFVLVYIYNGDNFDITIYNIRDIDLSVILKVFNHGVPSDDKIVNFTCDVSSFPFHNERIFGEYAVQDMFRNLKLNKPVPLRIDKRVGTDGRDEYIAHIDEIDMEVSSWTIGRAKRDIAEKVYNLYMEIREGKTISEINNEWTVDDVRKIMKFFNKYIKYIDSHEKHSEVSLKEIEGEKNE